MHPILATRTSQVPITNNWRKPGPSLALEAQLGLVHANFPRQLALGQMLGHYRLVERVSSGGMGIVYRGHDEHLQREVALKVLAPACLDDAVACRRFRDEALTLSRLNHPNIATVYDFDTQDGIDFLIMEYIPGRTLSARLETGPLTQQEVVEIGAQIAAALQEAHSEGIIHRDLKPQNIMLTPKGQVKVADFGLAKVFLPGIDTAATTDVTRELEIIGTLPYMAPEQLRGEPADFRSDIYSTGALLYELATNQRPFPETQGPRLVDSILHKIPAHPSTVAPGVSRAFENIVLKCLEKELLRRYQSAAELGVDLQLIGTSILSLAN